MAEENYGLENLFDPKEPEDETADLTVCCGEQTWLLHSDLMAKNSDFFKTAIDVPMKEKAENKIEIVDMEQDIFGKVVNFIYTQELNVEPETVALLLEAAERFQIEELKENIGLKIEKSMMNKENVIEFARLAQLFNVKALKKSSLIFIRTKNVELKAKDIQAVPYLFIRLMSIQKKQLKMLMSAKTAMEKEKNKEIASLKNNLSIAESSRNYDHFYNDYSDDDDRYRARGNYRGHEERMFGSFGPRLGRPSSPSPDNICDTGCGHCGSCYM
eukprot:GFUD01006313.1.p1 GENE.GFUD01006313.1~~GFUD01006313.1.p1  ORF type:complete len:280 (-),score=75.05 GFUD01006313.1:134-949(-)